MRESKRLISIIAILVVLLVASLTTTIVVLVAANQKASSIINISYTAEDVHVKMSAKAYVGGEEHVFRRGGIETGSDKLELDPNNTTGNLSQTENEIKFTEINDTIVLEYKFENMTSDVDADIYKSHNP